MKIHQQLDACLASVRAKTDFVPVLGLVLGSGLGGFAAEMEIAAAVPYAEIEGFPVSTVAGHAGQYLFGTVAGVPIVAMQGRVHFYEGYSMQEVVLPVRLMQRMGARAVLLTNAAGGINFSFAAGDFMLLRDQIAAFVPSPLIGENEDALGVRFPSMNGLYDPALCDIIRKAAANEGIPLHEGIYLQMSGPQYENPAEIRMCRLLGADAVGMSTACEAIAAKHIGLRVAGISCITNLASGMTQEIPTHESVQATAARASAQFTRLVRAAIADLGKVL